MVVVVELARGTGKNPDVPQWLRGDYFQAIQDLAKIAAAEVLNAKDADNIRAMLSILAVAKGARTHSRFLLNYSEGELSDLERRT